MEMPREKRSRGIIVVFVIVGLLGLNSLISFLQPKVLFGDIVILSQGIIHQNSSKIFTVKFKANYFKQEENRQIAEEILPEAIRVADRLGCKIVFIEANTRIPLFGLDYDFGDRYEWDKCEDGEWRYNTKWD